MPEQKKYTRKLTYNERLFIVADEICPPLLNQLFFDGEGSFDAEMWSRAVEAASEANPGSRLVLRGSLGMSRWEDSGSAPRVIEVDGSVWDGMGPDGAPFLQKRLMPRQGPTCEVLLIKGDPLRVCFRTHHAVMDGRGTLTWAEDIFRALRGEPLIGSRSTLSDLELARSVQPEWRTPFPRDNIAPTGKTSGSERGVTWKRMFIPGSYNNFLGQVAVLAAREAWKHQQGPVRFGVPVDIRFRRKGLRSTGNLSIAIYIEVRPDSTPEEIAQDVKKQIDEKRDCMIDRWDPMIRFLPLGFLYKKGQEMILNNAAKNRYGLSGILTNMGKIPMEIFSGGGFRARAFWGIPPSLENTPFFLGMASHDHTSELIVTMPKNLAGGNRIDTVLDAIRSGLVAV
ncbi:MAG TPA: hypothetical protein PK926_01215 [Spirochaetota bacterium]|nr:hypothetical protein [Spirochaetota bacterium]HPI88648.1 hypothetical protein [Spirochaetota bacterium]HPR49586.1 hypothetical protein [Spirochaetota bacterium]